MWRLWPGLAALALVACGPPPPPVAEDLVGVWYHAKAGDTVAKVAKRHKVYVEDILELNGLESQNLKVGQEIFLYDIDELVKRLPKSKATGKGHTRFVWPVGRGGVVSSGYGKRGGRMHKGLDIAAKRGTAVYAAAAGKVVYSNNKQRGYGNLVILRHVGGYVTVYAHHKRNLVDEGEHVRQGAKIAEVGNTGRSSGPHLHFEIRVNGKARNPLDFLPAR